MPGRGEGLAGGGRQAGDGPAGANTEPAGEAHCGRDSRDLPAQLTDLPTNERPPTPAARPARPFRWPLAAALACLFALPTLAEAQAPSVLSLGTLQPGTYALDDTISVAVFFTAAVTVTGTPQLALRIGNKTRQADSASGSGTTQLVFSYTVAEYDRATDGIEVLDNGLALNGGTIAASGTAARITHGNQLYSSALVDGVPKTEVPANWSLIPSGLGPGDRFRLLFATSTTGDASCTDIADYNTFVQTAAAAGHAAIQAHSAFFRVVGSTADDDARDNTDASGHSVAATVTFDAAVDIAGLIPVHLHVFRDACGGARG